MMIATRERAAADLGGNVGMQLEIQALVPIARSAPLSRPSALPASR